METKMKAEFSMEDRCSEKHEEKNPKIPSYYLCLVFFYLLLMGYFASLIDNALPSVVSIEDAGTNKFSEQRAYGYLEYIVGDGPRVAGTRYHLEKTEDLKGLLDEVQRNATQEVRVDWQIASGDYWLAYKRPHVNVFHNVSNIIAVLEGESGFNADGTTNSSILFNCHYDSVPTSPGVSDNSLFCAAMVETLSILSKRETKFKHNIIFLFNGAEENPLQGSAAFLLHPWARGVTALVNLDSAGMNSKSVLFQVTDIRVVKSYSRSVSRPSAQAFGEFLFSSGIVPSDTDFRIFRDFADIYGVDIAFTKQGHVYHTRHDALTALKSGVIQHSGNTLLELATDMADDADYSTKAEIETAIYWDYLNVFMVAYSVSSSMAIEALVVLLAVLSIFYYLHVVGWSKTQIRDLALSVVGRLLSCVAGVACLWIFTTLMVASTIQLRYLSNAWIVVPIYWMPYVIGAVTASQVYDAWRCKKTGLNRSRRVAQAMTATRFIAAAVTVGLALVSSTVTMRYILTTPLLLSSAVSCINLAVLKRYRLKGYQHLLLELIMSTPALLFYMVVAIKLNGLMLPIMGRSPGVTPDYLVAGLNMALVAVVCLPLSGLELLFSRLRLWMVVTTFSVTCIIICFIPFSPYQESYTSPAMQRHYWFHSDIRAYNASNIQTDRHTGILLARTEINTPQGVLQVAADNNIALNYSTDFSEACDQYTYCNFATYSPRTEENLKGSIWVEFEPPTESNPPPVFNLDSRTCNDTICTMHYSFTGPSHRSVIIHPRENVTVESWSLSTPVTATTYLHDRPVYYVYYSKATFSEENVPFSFSVDYGVQNVNTNEPIIDLAYMCHRTYQPDQYTAAYNNLVNSMPDYYNVATYLSSRYNYVF